MTRLRHVDPATRGYTRKKHGGGFRYLDLDGSVLGGDDLARAKGLVIPPAWRDVWICPQANGHIQATGVDARGRRQYRYHDDWRTRRDQQKFDHMIRFGKVLPDLRSKIVLDLGGSDMDRQRVLAAAVRLLDLGFFRIGGEDYAETNNTFGLATMRKSHVTLHPKSSELTFDYTAKSSKHRVQNIVDPEVFSVIADLKRRRSGGPELLAFRDGRRWVDVKSADINAYVKEITGNDFTAKDFRTWNATVLMSVGLAISSELIEHGSATARKRAITRCVTEVSNYLGNTPAVARKSYIDPRIIDRFNHRQTINSALDRLGVDTPAGHPATQGAIEKAVLDLLAR